MPRSHHPTIVRHEVLRIQKSCLSRHGVRASGEQLRNTGRLVASVSQPEGGTQTCTTGTHDHTIVRVINHRIRAGNAGTG